MSKLAKLQEEKLEQLKMLSSAGRVQLEEALAPETAPKSPALREIVSAEEPEAPATTQTSEMLVQKPGAQIGRPWETAWEASVCGGNEGVDGLSSRIGLRAVGSLGQ